MEQKIKSLIKGVGVDLASISRMKKLFKKYDGDELLYVYSPREISYFKKKKRFQLFPFISFSGKEAVSKALGTGFAEINLNDIQVFPTHKFVLQINLKNSAEKVANSLSISQWWGEWKITKKFIIATVVAK